MVDKTWVFTSYMFAFLAVYLSVVLYSIAPTIFKMDINWEMEVEMNTTSWFIYSANSTVGTATTAQWLPLIGIVLAAAAVLSVLVSGFAMHRGVG